MQRDAGNVKYGKTFSPCVPGPWTRMEVSIFSFAIQGPDRVLNYCNNRPITGQSLVADFSSTPITKNAFLNMKRNDEKTALLLAFRMGHLEIAKLLIENGADLQAEASGNKTALHFAAKSGNVEVVTFLVEHMFPTDVQDKKKRTPLH